MHRLARNDAEEVLELLRFLGGEAGREALENGVISVDNTSGW